MCCSAMALNLAEYKIRYPEFPKYVWDSPHPYSEIMNIKKDRRNPEHTKRPLNAFMLFAKIQREHITTHFNCNHSEISKALGRLWQDLSREEKEPFTEGAKTLVALHRIEYPDYKYRPRKKGQPKEAASAAAVSSGGSPTKKASQKRPASRAARSGERAAVRRADSTGDWVCEPVSERGSEAAMELCRPVGVSLGSPAPPESPLSFCLASPSRYHTPCSPVSIGSSSGYESELPPELPSDLHVDMQTELQSAFSPELQSTFSPELPEPKCELSGPELPYKLPARSGDEYELRPVEEDPLHGFGPEPEIGADLRDIEVTALGESALLNPLAMFPALGLTCDDLDELRLHL
ncbi:putative transcription factor SOX-14 [Amphibalanus amphitrite]|uniref:Putative transcription factor SOX-14 n=1 Tax=Amphibalanus amphitrite TaxID=1232801 RepID=A0A6A4XB86_AMPAM|nr:putative transcription factor SOX-14 [Amphibalanus amphitrite]